MLKTGRFIIEPSAIHCKTVAWVSDSITRQLSNYVAIKFFVMMNLASVVKLA
jgi:hypothetical protein